jgi:hypothetical protein
VVVRQKARTILVECVQKCVLCHFYEVAESTARSGRKTNREHGENMDYRLVLQFSENDLLHFDALVNLATFERAKPLLSEASLLSKVRVAYP